MNRQEKEGHLRKQIDFLYAPDDTFEVCLIGVPVKKHLLWGNEYTNGIVAGWFVDVDKAVKAVMEAEEQVKPTGIYVTVNPCNPQMRAISDEQLRPIKARTSDKFIDRIENFFIDIDPVRPSGTSSSVGQLGFALEKAYEVRDFLPGKDGCMFALSGNGYHLTYKADGASTQDIEKIIKFVSEKFSDEYVGIDKVVFNPARLTKAYGTTARKGKEVKSLNIEHRVAVIKEGCDGRI